MPEETEPNYFAHLEELRHRLLISMAVIGVFTVGCFFLSEWLVGIMIAPIQNSVRELYFLTPYEAFLTRLKVSVTAGVMLSSPVVFAQLWRFVAPGLYRSERRAVFPVVFFSVLLFSLGVLFAYFLVIPFALRFFLGFETVSLRPLISIGAYSSFFLAFILAFGIVFVFPVILVGCVYFGILDVRTLCRQRKVVIVLAFIVSAVLTPTVDVVTQCVMALVLWALFEISLVVGRLIEHKGGA